MKVAFSFKLQAASAGLVLAMLSSGCAMIAPRAEQVTVKPLGSSWVSSRTDSGSFGSAKVNITTKVGEQTWQGKQMVAFETPESTTLTYASGDLLGYFKGGTPLVTFDPPIGLAWPLEVGKSQNTSRRMTIHASKQVVSFEYAQKIEAYEEVTVSAGTFKSFKISTSDTIGNETVHWYSPELGIFVKTISIRTAKHAAGPGRRDVEVVSQTITK